MKSHILALLMLSGTLTTSLTAMDDEKPRRNWKEKFALATTPIDTFFNTTSRTFYGLVASLRPAASVPESAHEAPPAQSAQEPVAPQPATPLDEQIHDFFRTNSNLAIARIEHETLVPDEHPTFCDEDSYDVDSPIVLGLVRPGDESTVVYTSPEQWAYSVVLPGVSRGWIERGLDFTKSQVVAIRIYTQKQRRILKLTQELSMTEQAQRENFMPTLIPPHESSIAVLAAAEGIVLDDAETLSTEQRTRLQSRVRATYGKSIEEIERLDKQAQKETAELQETVCSTWIESLGTTSPAPRPVPVIARPSTVYHQLHDLHAHLISIAQDESRSLCDRLNAIYQESAHWSELVAQAGKSTEELVRLHAEVSHACDELNGLATAQWIALQQEAQEIKNALAANPHKNLEREQQRYEHWLHTVQNTLGIVEQSAIAAEQHQVIKQLEEAFARAYQAL